jgi:putative transposon-encoded protein
MVTINQNKRKTTMPNENISISFYKKVRSFGNTRMLHYKYVGATNTKSSRIKITDKWFKKSITIPFSYEYSCTGDNVIAYLLKNNWCVSGINREDQIITIDGWDSDKQLK